MGNVPPPESLRMKHFSMKRSGSAKNQVQDKPKNDEEREDRINYTLDMVVHDLVSHGHLQPAKSYLLKTAEMKNHIGKMCDQLNRRKKQEEMMKISRNLPKSYSTATNKLRSKTPGNLINSITSNTKQQHANNNNLTHKKDDYVSEYSVDDSTDVLKKKHGAVVLSRSSHLPTTHPQHIHSNKSPNSGQTHSYNRRRADPWMTPRDITDEKAAVKADYSMAHKEHKENSKAIHLNASSNVSQHNVAHAQAYRAKIDFSGFANEEISLDLDGRRLTITASRPKKVQQNARKVTEYIEIPEGVHLENLKIGRRLDGSLLIEEFVPGVD